MFFAKSEESRNQDFNQRGINLTQEELLKPSDTWHVLDKQVQEEIKSARLDLAQEFRTLIGVA